MSPWCLVRLCLGRADSTELGTDLSRCRRACMCASGINDAHSPEPARIRVSLASGPDLGTGASGHPQTSYLAPTCPDDIRSAPQPVLNAPTGMASLCIARANVLIADSRLQTPDETRRLVWRRWPGFSRSASRLRNPIYRAQCRELHRWHVRYLLLPDRCSAVRHVLPVHVTGACPSYGDDP